MPKTKLAVFNDAVKSLELDITFSYGNLIDSASGDPKGSHFGAFLGNISREYPKEALCRI